MTEVSAKRSNKKSVAVEKPPETTVSLPVRDPHNIGVVFANTVIGSGHLNGNLNITFGVYNFSASGLGDGAKIDPDIVVCSRLRMDLACAEQLYAELGRILQQLKPANATTQ